MAERVYVGAAHESGRWVGVAFDDAGEVETDVYDEVGALWLRHEDRAERILVGVPVGLYGRATGSAPASTPAGPAGGAAGDGNAAAGGDGDSDRECDRLMRAVLGPRSDVVFAPPARPAARRRRYTAAARVNERVAGRPLSRRSFEASTAIAAVDELLQELPESRAVVAESHPELCYRAFAGEPLSYGPDTAGGYAERMRALAEFDRDAPPAVQRAASATAGHDLRVATVLDAVALAYTARPGPGEVRSLPPDPPTDPTGLPMRVCYRSERPLSSDAED